MARTFTSGSGGFAIEADRHIAKRPSSADRPGAPREKLSAARLALRYGGAIGSDDLLSIGLSAALEKRRFALDLSEGHPSTSKAIGVEATWRHGPSWQLAAGYRSDFGSSRSTGLLRSIELAEGATRSQRGAWAMIGYSPGGATSRHDLSFGFRLQALHLDEGDRQALGMVRPNDTRIAFTTSFRFR